MWFVSFCPSPPLSFFSIWLVCLIVRGKVVASGPVGLEEQVAMWWNGFSVLICKNNVAVCNCLPDRKDLKVRSRRAAIEEQRIHNFRVNFRQLLFSYMWITFRMNNCLYLFCETFIKSTCSLTQMDYRITFPDDLCRVCSPAGPWEFPLQKYLLPTTLRACLTSRLASRRMV